jgi:hypothetical protein
MEPIELKYVFSAETDILTTLESVSKFVQNVYFVNKGNKIIGYFFFEDLLGDHLSIDLLSLVLDFEKICLKICCLDPEDNFNNLSKSIKNNIMGKYFKRGLLLKDGEIPYYVKTMELTSLKEKMIILSNNPNLILFLPAINDQKFIEITYDLRNNVVHPEESDSLTKLFTKQDLWKYIVRLKALTLALKQYYELVKKDDQESEALFEITD